MVATLNDKAFYMSDMTKEKIFNYYKSGKIDIDFTKSCDLQRVALEVSIKE